MTNVAAHETAALERFRQSVAPILEKHCYECHGDGAKKAGLAFDELTSPQQILHNPEVWLKVLRNTRSHIMPPPDGPQPTATEQSSLERWIVTDGFGLDPAEPDPGRVTVRRLNRAEYQNTIRDLLGVDFDAEALLAADDIGYGFDNISDVLTLSPMRMEKFIAAAQTVVKKGVPEDFRAISEHTAVGKNFVSEDGRLGDVMTFYEERKVSHTFKIPVAGDYRVIMAVSVDGRTNPDPGRVRVTVSCDGQDFHTKEYKWADCGYFTEELPMKLTSGEHRFQYHLESLEPKEKQRGKMDFRIDHVHLVGPTEKKDWLPAPGYARFFPRPKAPEDIAGRRAYARDVLANFAAKAYRRPQSDAVVDRLVNLAESFYQTPGHTFEFGIGRAMVAVLASPRFLFRFEENVPGAMGKVFAEVDEYSLASRLSYFLWSSMPDDELMRLAQQGTLRKNLSAQVTRMLADPKSAALVKNFTGQWLLSKDILHVSLNLPLVLAREGIKVAPPRRGPGTPGQPAPVTDVTLAQREAMKTEAEGYFNYIAHDNRSLLELVDSDYAFLNETLAGYYGLPADTVKGHELRRVVLPIDDPRGGGVITMGSTLAVTSNPTRTSPVKRGKWILENILGAPAPPPPPDVPSLEDTEKRITGRAPTQRELLAIHRENPTCASCHSRMDPLGLALENFNAVGLHRTQELEQPVDATGTLMTGEAFKNIRELKRILTTQHRVEIYRTLTEKLLTYSLGRGVEYYDVPAIDRIVARLEANEGRFSELLMGVVESVPFQQRRAPDEARGIEAAPRVGTLDE